MANETMSQIPNQGEESVQNSNPRKYNIIIIVIISVLLTAIVTGLLVYYWQKTSNEKSMSTMENEISTLKQQISDDEITTEDVTVQVSPTEPVLPTENDNLYTDPNGRFTFLLPNNWEVTEKVPDKFRAQTSYVENGDVEGWSKGKMMSEKCRGPILQNTSDPNQLIAFEILETNGDGAFCWSTGYFMDDDKWKVSESYTYPVGSNTSHVPDWKGDFLMMKTAEENSVNIAIASLINFETYQLIGEEDLDTIISSFEFTK